KKAEDAGNDDIMKALGGKSDDKSVEPSKEDAAADDLMKALGGKSDAKPEAKTKGKPTPPSGKSKDELAAEEIEKALRGGK
ncbi:MAG: hypothetical protein ABI790_15345, partial [Betaproteobacteria bacterium]